ncbi:MAG: DUF4105 domain-containing protein [Bdellovibrionia bacterium]
MRFQWIRWFVAVASFTVCFNAQSSATDDFRLSLDRKEITAFNKDEINGMERFLSEVSGKLPEKMKRAIGGEIRIRFADVESDWFNRCQWNQIMGFKLSSSQGRIITLERSLGTAMIRGSAFPRGCGYASADQFAMATLIREIARVYDRQAGLSNDPQMQTLLGAAEIGGILPKRRIGEETSDRSPDVSEFESSQEGLAVNIERFAMDPEFECRRPALAHKLASELGWNPFPLNGPAKPCEINATVPLSQEEVSGAAVRFVRLDPKRLYQVHYLFASQGKETMSRWGHAMYRLVFCAPERAAPGPECLKDVSYHVVVSFRANVQGYEISPLKGMNGDYPSQLYLLSLLEVMREYNADELRDLISLPLNLSEYQTREFLYRSLQLFWEYHGRYQFLSNNCATEALNLLKSVVADPKFHKDVHVVTPIGLYDALKGARLMDESFVQDRRQAKEQGYLFASERPRLERAFQAIHVEKAISADLDSYLEKTKASDRMNQFKQQPSLASQYFILESYLVRKQQATFFKQVVEFLQDEDSRARLDPNGTLLHSVMRAKELEESLTPQKLAPRGYGISLPSDFQADLENKINQARLELKQITETLRQALETHFSDRYQELLQTVENRRSFARAMKD